MKSIHNYLTSSLCLIAILMLAIGCSEEYKYTTDYSSYDNVKLKVKLTDENNVLAIKLKNGKHSINLDVTPEDVFIDNKAYIYEVNDKTIATVSQEGELTLLKAGETTLTVKFRGNKNISTSCTLRVLPTLVTEIIVADTEIKVEEGKTVDLSECVTAIPSDAENQVLKYTVKEGYTDYASIVEGSTLQGEQKGEAFIIATTTDGSNISKEFKVNVTGKILIEEIQLNTVASLSGKTIAIGQVFDLKAIITVFPTNASEQTLKYSIISGEGVISLDQNGILKALATGEAEIEIATIDNSKLKKTLKLKVDATQSWFERALWKVDTSIVYADGNNYTPDNDKGTPGQLIDGKDNTYLALTKPGKNYNGHATPANHQLYFTIDMGAEQEFNNIKWTHRDKDAGFQVHKMNLYGSKDGKSYTEIVKDIELKSTTQAIIEKSIPLSKYRYIKAEFKEWDTVNKSNICIAEFNVSRK